MAKNPRLSSEAANAEADAVSAMLDGGTVEIYTAPQPLSPEVAITTQTLLAVLDFSTPAFLSAVDGVAVANAISDETDTPATGTASWFRCKTSGGTAVYDGSVGTSDADMVISDTTIVEHARVSIDSFIYTARRS